MHRFSVTRDIPHDPKLVWALFDNFADIWKQSARRSLLAVCLVFSSHVGQHLLELGDVDWLA